MKICITSQGQDLSARIDPRFGRCQYFIIVDPESLEFEAIRNSNVAAGSGAGIQSGQLMADKGAEVLLTGNVGPNAFNTLQAAGIKIITGVAGTVKEAIERFNKGEFQEVSGPTVASKSGLGGGQAQAAGPAPGQKGQGSGLGPGMGSGMGMGRGMGGGMGRGMGMGQGMGMGRQQSPQMPPQMSKEQELQMLKSQVEALSQQMGWINQRIDELSKE